MHFFFLGVSWVAGFFVLRLFWFVLWLCKLSQAVQCKQCRKGSVRAVSPLERRFKSHLPYLDFRLNLGLFSQISLIFGVMGEGESFDTILPVKCLTSTVLDSFKLSVQTFSVYYQFAIGK